MDCRHPFGRFDEQILGWATVAELPVHILLSKSDKLGKNQQTNTLRSVRQQLGSMDLQGSVQLFSATKKTGIDELGKALAEFGVEILSTGGTAQALAQAGVPIQEVSQFTGFPEMLDGRVKTLHPKIHGGILAIRSRPEHARAMQ